MRTLQLKSPTSEQGTSVTIPADMRASCCQETIPVRAQSRVNCASANFWAYLASNADGHRSQSQRRPRTLHPTPPRLHPRTGYGDATVTPRRDYGEAPMGTDPHGSRTGISPGSRRGHTGAAGWEPVNAGGHRKEHSRPAGESGNSNLLVQLFNPPLLVEGARAVAYVMVACQMLAWTGWGQPSTGQPA